MRWTRLAGRGINAENAPLWISSRVIPTILITKLASTFQASESVANLIAHNAL